MIDKKELMITFGNIKSKILAKRDNYEKNSEKNIFLEEMITAVDNNMNQNLTVNSGNKVEVKEQQKSNNSLTEDSLNAEVKKINVKEHKLVTKNNIKNILPVLVGNIFGQDEVINEIVDVLKVSALNIQINKDKPAGNYLFAGPSGVGKTELATVLAQSIEAPILVINMGEYGLEQDITKLIGTSPGYVGYNEGGILTNFVMQNPRSVILFDEIEKAHPSADKILLSIMDKGIATDNKGVNALFKNTIIVSTTNLGAEIEYEDTFSKEDKFKYRLEVLRANLRPEILNRYDSIFQFEPLNSENYKKVIVKFLKSIIDSMALEHNISIKFSDKLINFIVDKSYDPSLGGRPARRFIEKIVIKPLADYMLFESTEELFENVKSITMDLDKKGNICFKGKSNKIISSLQNTQSLVEKVQANKFS